MTTAKWMLCVIAASIASSYITFCFNQINKSELDAALSVESLRPLNHFGDNAAPRQASEKVADSARINCDKKFNEMEIGPALSAKEGVVEAPFEQSSSIESIRFAYEKKQHEITMFRDFVANKGESVASVIGKNYDSEPLDPEWARLKEDELLAIMDTNKALQNTAPVELSCKSQNCRLILSVLDENHGQSLYSAFKDEALKGNDENNSQVISYFSNPDSGEIYIYLSKNSVTDLIHQNVD